MPRIGFAFLSLVLTLALTPAVSQYWTGPYQLTTDRADDVNPSACKEWLWGNMTCLVWQTDRNGNWDINSRFCNFVNGNGWGPELPVCTLPDQDVNPAVACMNDWQDHPSYWCVWERRESPILGSIWASFTTWRDQWWPPLRIGRCLNTTGDSARPSVVVVKGGQVDTVWVVWMEKDTGGWYVSYSFHDGSAWSAPGVAVWSGDEIRHARIGRGFSARHNWVDYPLLVWERQGDIWFSEYVGGLWTQPQQVAPSPAPDRSPEVVSHSELPLRHGPWIVWESERDGDTAVYGTAADSFEVGRRWCDSTGAGANQDPEGTPADYTTEYSAPLVAVWVSDRNGNPDIYSSLLFSPRDLAVDTNPATDLNPTVTTMGVTMHWCCWQSNRSGNWDIFGSYVYCTGVAEGNTEVRCVPCRTRFATNTLVLENAESGLLLGTDGRLAARLVKGFNPVGHLAPGVYFLETERSGAGEKVLIGR